MGYLKGLEIQMNEEGYKEKKQELMNALYFYVALLISGFVGLFSLIFSGFSETNKTVQCVIFIIFIMLIILTSVLAIVKFISYYNHTEPERIISLSEKDAKKLRRQRGKQ